MIAADQVKANTEQMNQSQTLEHSRTLLSRQNLPLLALVVAGVLVVLSLLVPYWTITLHAPQYPMGLNVDAYAYKLTGDVSEVDGLNHYIGMMELNEAAKLERAISRFALPVIAALAVASFWLRGIWRWLAAAPVIVYPVVFIVDLAAWLYYAGNTLDPTAALSSSIKPFTPQVFGTGTIGQFSTTADFKIGFYLILTASLLVLAATIAGRARQTTDG